MEQRIRKERKTYAMRRMVEAIGRAIASDSDADKARAARWATAWAALSGIRSAGLRVRRSDLIIERRRKPR
jgi:hypothetical protein